MKHIIQAIIGLTVICSASVAASMSWQSAQSWETGNHVPVYFIQTAWPKMVDVALAWRAGSAYDKKMPGLAYLTNALLMQATACQSSSQVAERMDQLGLQARYSVGRDQSVVAFRMVSQPTIVEQSSELAGDIVSAISFTNSDLKRVKQNTLSDIAFCRQSPSCLASQAFFKSLYAKHPYAHPVTGKASTVKQRSKREIKTFYEHFYTNRNAVMAIVGDLSVKQAKALSQRLTRDLPNGPEVQSISEAKQLNEGMQRHIHFPSQQTHSVIGHLGYPVDSQDRFALATANVILGGNPLTSKLFQTVRNQQGLAYRVGSHFKKLAGRGPFMITLQTRNAQSDRAVALAKQTYQQFINQGVTNQALAFSKKVLINQWQMSLSSNDQMLSQLLNAAYYHRGPGYLAKVPKKIEQLNINQVNQAIHRWMHADPLVTVTVGQ